MAATVIETDCRASAAVRAKLWKNTETAVGGSETTILNKVGVAGFTRFTIQLANTDGTDGVVKVYGSIRDPSGGSEGGTDWVQIGDDITVDSSAMKAISTTPLRFLCVRAEGETAALTCHVYGEQG
jgi:hypothetical protein